MPSKKRFQKPRAHFAVVVAVFCVTLLAGLAGLSFLRSLFLGVNVATFLAYGYDKHMARVRGWRVPEALLHTLAALGGSPAALLGQWLFHHKTSDSRFRRIFLIIVALQVAALLAYRFS